ncbi:hypothetical protein QSI_0381 [Clostridioides difficile P28]|nr:hypothetical protein QSI_0381 [Clostridioides difficile P28]
MLSLIRLLQEFLQPCMQFTDGSIVLYTSGYSTDNSTILYAQNQSTDASCIHS